MKNRRNIWIGLGILVLAGTLFYFFNLISNQRDWTPSLTKGNKEPYQLDVFYSLIPELHASQKPIENKLPFRQNRYTGKKHYNFLFAGSSMHMNEEDADSLLAFISNGNTAFISAPTFPEELLNKLRPIYTDTAALEEDEYYDYDMTAKDYIYAEQDAYKVHFAGSPESYNFKFLQKYGYSGYTWTALHDSIKFKAIYPFTPLAGSKKQGWSYSSFQIGKGKLYLHTLPITLTNLYLCTPKGLQYMNQLFADLPEGELIIDHYHHISRQDKNGNSKKTNTPLSYLLTQAPLRWTWYLGLILTIVFVFFYGKRKSTPIPLLYKVKNTSVEYAKTIGLLYQTRKQHKEIISLKIRHLKHFIKDRYRLVENNNPEIYTTQLAKLSGIEESKILKIMTQGSILERKATIPDVDMVNFQKQIDEFYKNCK